MSLNSVRKRRKSVDYRVVAPCKRCNRLTSNGRKVCTLCLDKSEPILKRVKPWEWKADEQ